MPGKRAHPFPQRVQRTVTPSASSGLVPSTPISRCRRTRLQQSGRIGSIGTQEYQCQQVGTPESGERARRKAKSYRFPSQPRREHAQRQGAARLVRLRCRTTLGKERRHCKKPGPSPLFRGTPGCSCRQLRIKLPPRVLLARSEWWQGLGKTSVA
jgi:hypothetical protein